jgi:hypothetical protein
MATTLNMTLLLRRAAFADSCVLQAGEPGYHTTTKEFKIGDGTTTWKELPIANKTQIEAIVNAAITAHAAGYYTKTEIDDIKTALQSATSKVATDLTAEVTARTNADTNLQNQITNKLASADFTSWKNTHETGHAKSASEITTEITNAVNGEKTLREQADAAINNKIGGSFDATNTVAKAITAAEAAAKAHAESKATAAQTAAIAEAESKDAARAQAATNALNSAVSALETKISDGDAATLASAKAYTDEKVAAEAKLRSDADNALDERIDKLEAFFEGADHDGESGGLKDALDTLVEIQNYIESEGSVADDMVKDIAQNTSDISALSSRVGVNEGAITTLGTSKLDKSVYDAYINGKSLSDAELKSYADGKASAAQTAAITEAGKLDTALHTEISKEIDADVKAAIDTEIARANGAYDPKGAAATAEANAKSHANSADAALKTALEGVASTAKSSDTTIAGAKKYADEKASAAETNATSAVIGTSSDTKTDNTIYGAKAFATDAANTAKSAVIGTSSDTKASDTIKGAKKYADDAASTAKSEAIAAVVGTAKDGADTDTIEGVRKAFAAADTTVLSTAKTYAEQQVTNAHKDFQTATVKDAAHDSATDPSFITSITLTKGHVTGATVRNLAEVLSAMEFIFDGGTAPNTVEI